MEELLIPFAVDETGELCSPKDAKKGKNYFCPLCRELVVFRKGKVKKPHFAHKPNTKCNEETIIHKTAKLLIQQVVHKWKANKISVPMLKKKCRICGKHIDQALPDIIDNALIEYKLPNGFIADVALMSGPDVYLAVEIKVTHPVDDLKARSISVSFIELEGRQVIENPTVWKPVRDNLESLTCSECKSVYLKFQAKAKKIAQAVGIELPSTYYRYGITKCWNCGREIIVFAWPKNMWSDADPKLKPYPKTIQFRFSGTAGSKYWVNTCPYCEAIQGDFFLHSEPDGPFFGISIEEDSTEAFEEDMRRIAWYASVNGLIKG